MGPRRTTRGSLDAALNARKLLAEVAARRLRVAVRRVKHVAIGEVLQTWTEPVARAIAMLRKNREQELPPTPPGCPASHPLLKSLSASFAMLPP